MENFTLESVRAMFKKCECYKPIPPKCQIHVPNFLITPKKEKKIKILKKGQ
jgi:hypothetical protein